MRLIDLEPSRGVPPKGAPKMYAESWRSVCEELHFLQHCGLYACNFAKLNSFPDIFQGLC